MSTLSGSSHKPAIVHGEVSKRRIRKGTQSCWECKRRKIRCNFASRTDRICDGCKCRKTKCISQEYPDLATKADGNQELLDRINHLETAVDRLSRAIEPSEQKSDNFAPDDEPTQGTTDHVSSINGFDVGGKVKLSLGRGGFNHDDSLPDHGGNASNQEAVVSRSPRVEAQHVQLKSSENTKAFEDISYELFKMWPGERDIEIFLSHPGPVSGLFHGTTFGPASKILQKQPPSIRQIMQPPSLRCHPVLSARKLLVLATYLQNLSPIRAAALKSSGVDALRLMSSAAEAVYNSVTCNESLLDSMEGLECLAIEGMYLSNAGELQRAWHSVHRAILIAQLMGLHRNAGTRPLKYLDLGTRTRVQPEYIYFRLIQSSRYLSLMLGLSPGFVDNSFARPSVLESFTPAERMQRIDCAAAGLIMQRNEEGLFDMATTRMIDNMLQTAAASHPPSWWLMPKFEANTRDEMKTLGTLLRTMDQLTHYFLLTQLHLPHLLQPHQDHEHDYYKIMAIDASREILTRFTSMHGVHCFTSFCRGISILAFLACTTICIVYIDAERQRKSCSHASNTFLDLLSSQHQKDRGMMELTLHCMRQRALQERDQIAAKTTPILDHLLSLDPPYTKVIMDQSSDAESERQICLDSRVSDSGQVVQIRLPHIGMVNFEQGKDCLQESTELRSKDIRSASLFIESPNLFNSGLWEPVPATSSDSSFIDHTMPETSFLFASNSFS